MESSASDSLTKSGTKKNILDILKLIDIKSTVGGIIGGIIVIPLWQYIIQPLSSNAINYFFNFLFSLSKTIESSIFISIAKHTVLHSVTNIEGYIIMAVAGFGIGLGASLSRINKNKREIKSIDVEKTNNKNPSSLLLVLKTNSYLLILLSIIMIAQYGTLSYGSEKIDTFTHKLTICEPYMSPHELSLIKSRFALIGNRKDYNLIISQLDNVLIKNKIIIPKGLRDRELDFIKSFIR